MGETPPFPGTKQSSEGGDRQILPGRLRTAETRVSGGVEGGEGERGHVPSPHLGRRGGEGQGVGGQHQRHVREDVNIIPPTTTVCCYHPLSVFSLPSSIHCTQHKGSTPFHSHFPFSISETHSSPMRFLCSIIQVATACALLSQSVSW